MLSDWKQLVHLSAGYDEGSPVPAGYRLFCCLPPPSICMDRAVALGMHSKVGIRLEYPGSEWMLNTPVAFIANEDVAGALQILSMLSQRLI